MLFFTALMLTLGVKAQEGSTVEERGAAKGYYPFAAEVTEVEQITSLNQLTDGMEIMIEQNGLYLTIYSLPTYASAHMVFMQNKPVGVGVWTTQAVDANVGTFNLKSAHMVITNSTCLLGKLGYNYTTQSTLATTGYENYAGIYKFVPLTDGSGKWRIQCTNSDYQSYLSVDGKGEITELGYTNASCYFNVYQVKKKSTAEIKYVECDVTLTAPSGNMFTMNQKGWSDFYEFYTLPKDTIKNGVYLPNNYGVTLSNVFYHETSNEITGRVQFPFKVSGVYTKIPVHLNVPNNQNKRLTVGENNAVEFIEKPEPESAEWENWYNNQNNQWYIFPRLDEKRCFEYYIQNVKTEKYIYVNASGAVTLSETPTYFKLNEGAATGCVRFATSYSLNNTVYLGNLHESNGGVKVSNEYGSNKSLLVTTMSGDELGGEDAIGFVRRYTRGTSFWDGGQINPEDAPVELLEVFESPNHEGKDSNGSTHLLYCAETGIKVTKLGAVTATFEFTLGAGDQLAIFGVDIVNNFGEVVEADYHFGTAGLNPQNNTYTIENVYPGDYTIRYWVCHRTDYEDGKNHNLDNTSGKITVEGADYRIMFSQPLVNGTFAAQTTWFRLRLSDDLEKYISAQPAYMDAENNLMVTNNTPSNDYAGLWAVIGDKENGYKFYNRAWGPEYAMKTVGKDGAARTYMVPAAEASTYDIVQRDRSTKDYKFYVKLHGSENNYLQNYNGAYGTGHLSTWNNSAALGDAGSVMTFETVYMEGWDERTETIKNALAEKWMPWAAEPEVAPIIGDFAQLMLNRNSFALLDGKVFKFANQGNNNRTGKLLGVNASNQGAGLTATGNSEDYMQFIDNGDGTFKLFHIATARYLGVPNDAVTTTKSSEAAAYTYTFQDATQKEQLTFQTSGQTLHLQNSFVLMNYGSNDAASRWIVSYDENAQELGAVAIEAQEMLEEITSDAYLANAGQQGYASPAQIEAYQNAIQGLSGKSVAEAMSALETSMNAIEDAEKNIRYIDNLGLIKNTNIYGIHCARGPLAYVAGNSTTHLSTPKLNRAEDITANVVANANEQFAILRTENTPAGWYYLYNITTQKFVSKDFTLTENPVCAVNFRDISGYDADYRWEVWFGEIIDDKKVDTKLNVNQNEGLALNSYVDMDAGNKFRIEYAETNEAKTAPALALINALETAKADATALLNSVQGKVGYPNADACTNLQNAITAATNVAAVDAAVLAFKGTSNVNMPESGKAYILKLKYIGSGRQGYKYMNVGDGDAITFVADAETYPESAYFVCRKDEATGRYYFVPAKNGGFLSYQSIATTHLVSTCAWAVTPLYHYTYKDNINDKSVDNLWGHFCIKIDSRSASNDAWALIVNESTDEFDNSSEPYLNGSYTSAVQLVEVSYTLNSVKMNALGDDDDQLLTGLETGMSMSTFSAPYPTVTPEGITAYYAETITEGDSKVATLKKMRTAIPANQGVVLVGEVGVSGNFKMLPAAAEHVPAELNNRLSATGAQSVVMGQSGVDYILGRGSKGAGFYKAKAGSTLAAGKAYFHFDNQAQVRNFVLRFGGETTDIEDAVLAPATDNDAIYDLSGRRVNEVTKGGIYIKNGKKFIVK